MIIKKQEVARRAKEVQQSLYGQSVPQVQQSSVQVPVQLAAAQLPCPRCGKLMHREAKYCSNCSLPLSSSGASVHLPIPPQRATESIIPTRSVPEQPRVPPVPVSPAASTSGQAKPIELKTPPDKNDVRIESSSKKSVAEEQAQSNLVARPSKPINRRLGNYRLIRLLGNGGFADVYLGEHVLLETHAAIKVLHLRLTKEAIKDFIAEARMIARLVHPHIVRVLEFDVEGEEPDLEQSVLDMEGRIPIGADLRGGVGKKEGKKKNIALL